MNAFFIGVNLADILVQVSIAESVPTVEPSGREVQTHMLLMALLSKAAARWSRFDVVLELLRAIKGRAPYAESREELLPVRLDFQCLFPLAYVLTRLLLNPKSATALSIGSITSYSLSPGAARQIANLRTANVGSAV
jgi:hypothetical protein